MPDWREYVRNRIGHIGLDPAREQGIVSELADHLEDSYEDCLRRGTPEQEAALHLEQEVRDWAALSEAIRRTQSGEEIMNNRTKHLWLPGLATLTLSMVLLMILMRSGIQPLVVTLRPPYLLLFYVPWILALPLIGAVGAYWSRRAGGTRQAGVAAGLLPAWVLAVFFLAMWPLGWLIESYVRQVPARVNLSALALYLLNWGLIPAAALLVGALPFLRVAHPNPRRKMEY